MDNIIYGPYIRAPVIETKNKQDSLVFISSCSISPLSLACIFRTETGQRFGIPIKTPPVDIWYSQ